MSKQVTISVRNVGQAFGCEADLIDQSGKRIHTTRTYPYGFGANAYQGAKNWAEEHGYTVRDEGDDE